MVCIIFEPVAGYRNKAQHIADFFAEQHIKLKLIL